MESIKNISIFIKLKFYLSIVSGIIDIIVIINITIVNIFVVVTVQTEFRAYS